MKSSQDLRNIAEEARINQIPWTLLNDIECVMIESAKSGHLSASYQYDSTKFSSKQIWSAIGYLNKNGISATKGHYLDNIFVCWDK
jgi:alpha-glucosidase (family GH31 glycosyl hydrolase)